MSIMYEGCMEKGKDVSSGGAMYNFGPGVVWSGLATYADSMAAIKKLVFDDKKYTLEQLNEALKADFNGYEQIRTDCLNAPKYGNDDDYADDIAADLINFTEHEHRQYKTLYSILSHGTLSISNNTPFGQMTGASANGRHAWLPLSDGISPSQGADFKGPTAIIKTISKLSNDNMNRILRRWFPKGTNFDQVTEEEVERAAEWMNNYPRKILGWRSAGAVFEEYVAA